MRGLSGSPSSMFFMEDITHDLTLASPAAQVGSNTRHYFGTTAGTALAQAVDPHVVVQRFVGLKLRTAARQSDQPQTRLDGGGEPPAMAERWSGLPSTIRYTLPAACLSSHCMKWTNNRASNSPWNSVQAK